MIYSIPIPEIDDLLKADEENIPRIKHLLLNFTPEILYSISEASIFYRTMIKAFDCRLDNDESVSRALLLSLISNNYTSAMADFLRAKITAPLRCARVQCESLAILKIIKDYSPVALEWRGTKTLDDGLKFYRSHQKEINSILKTMGLKEQYDNFSATAVHARFRGMVLGLKMDLPYSIGYYVQEFNEKMPGVFILFVLNTLHVQKEIFLNLPGVCPEINDSALLEVKIPRFEKSINELFKIFYRKYPKYKIVIEKKRLEQNLKRK